MPRSRAQSQRPERSVEDFLEGAEKPRVDDRTVEQRIKDRAQGRYYPMVSYRGTEEQKRLIDYAKKREGGSIQRLFEDILMPELERRYGAELDSE